MMPARVHLRRTKGWRMPPNTVKVDRSTGFGNPFPVVKATQTVMGKTSDCWVVGTFSGPAMWFQDSKAEATALSVKAFEQWLQLPAQSGLLERVRTELHGKNLACWCKPGGGPCHADVLLKFANPIPENEPK